MLAIEYIRCTITKWKSFSDEEITKMDENMLEWWWGVERLYFQSNYSVEF